MAAASFLSKTDLALLSGTPPHGVDLAHNKKVAGQPSFGYAIL
jgi:hypothetical protein